MILKKLTSTFIIASLFSINISYADNIAEEKLKALKVLETYAKSIACGVEISEIPILIEYQPESEDSNKEVIFLVQWGGDDGCAGGTGTYFVHLNYVSYHRYAEYEYLIGSDLLEELSFSDENYFINSRFIESVKLNNQHQLEIIAGDLQEGDLNNFPSKSFKYTISLDKSKIIKVEFDHNNDYSN